MFECVHYFEIMVRNDVILFLLLTMICGLICLLYSLLQLRFLLMEVIDLLYSYPSFV